MLGDLGFRCLSAGFPGIALGAGLIGFANFGELFLGLVCPIPGCRYDRRGKRRARAS
jgi:hypothetical protein